MVTVTTTKRILLVVFLIAALTWGALILKAIRDPEGEPQRLAQVRTVALVVAFVAGSVVFTRRRQ